MEGILKTTRRAILRRGLLLLAGALGLGVAGRSNAGEAALKAPTSGASLRLYGRHWHLYSQERRSGELPVKGDRTMVYGELLDSPDGNKVGEFYSVCFCLQSPFGPSPVAAASAELHTFNLLDGTIVGLGTTGPSMTGESVYAILGGTGRYVGTRGSYVACQRPQELGGDGTAEFTLTLMLSG